MSSDCKPTKSSARWPYIVLFVLYPRYKESSWLLLKSWFDDKQLIKTHWDRLTHICVSKLTFIASDNGLSSGRRQTLIWTNVGILFSTPLGTNFNEILIEIDRFSFTKIHFKMSFGKWQPFCLGLNMLTVQCASYKIRKISGCACAGNAGNVFLTTAV